MTTQYVPFRLLNRDRPPRAALDHPRTRPGATQVLAGGSEQREKHRHLAHLPRELHWTWGAGAADGSLSRQNPRSTLHPRSGASVDPTHAKSSLRNKTSVTTLNRGCYRAPGRERTRRGVGGSQKWASSCPEGEQTMREAVQGRGPQTGPGPGWCDSRAQNHSLLL